MLRRALIVTCSCVLLFVMAVATWGFALAGPRPYLRVDKRILPRGESVRATVSWDGEVRFVALVWDGPVSGSAVRHADGLKRYVFDKELVRLPAGRYHVRGLAGDADDAMYHTATLSLCVTGGFEIDDECLQ